MPSDEGRLASGAGDVRGSSANTLSADDAFAPHMPGPSESARRTGAPAGNCAAKAPYPVASHDSTAAL